MTKLADFANHAKNSIRSNSPEILTGMGVGGVLSTSYLTAKGTVEAVRILEQKHQCRLYDVPKLTKADAKHVWKKYIPAIASGVLTIGVIVGAGRLGSKRTAAAYSLLSLSEHAFTEYKSKVVEQIGEKKEAAVRDEIAADRLKNNPAQGAIIIGTGTVLCYEMHTGRYFNCDMETLRKAQNTINAQMIRENYANLNDFYHLVGLPSNSFSSVAGWSNDRMLELQFSTAMTEDNRPCITFDYNYIMAV